MLNEQLSLDFWNIPYCPEKCTHVPRCTSLWTGAKKNHKITKTPHHARDELHLGILLLREST